MKGQSCFTMLGVCSFGSAIVLSGCGVSTVSKVSEQSARDSIRAEMTQAAAGFAAKITPEDRKSARENIVESQADIRWAVAAEVLAARGEPGPRLTGFQKRRTTTDGRPVFWIFWISSEKVPQNSMSMTFYSLRSDRVAEVDLDALRRSNPEAIWRNGVFTTLLFELDDAKPLDQRSAPLHLSCPPEEVAAVSISTPSAFDILVYDGRGDF